MEQYIKEKYFNLKSQIKEKQKHEITDYRELNQVEWKVFEMDNIFRFVQGKSKGLNHLKKEETCRISQQSITIMEY